MTWDVLLLRVQPTIQSADDLSEDAVIPLGAPSAVRATVTRVCPRATFSDPATGHLSAGGATIRFSVGDDDPVRGIMLTINGSGDDAITVIRALCEANGWRAFDMATEEFMEFA